MREMRCSVIVELCWSDRRLLLLLLLLSTTLAKPGRVSTCSAANVSPRMAANYMCVSNDIFDPAKSFSSMCTCVLGM